MSHFRPQPLAGLTAMQTGMLCVLLATLVFVSMDIMAKTLATRYDPFFVVWARYAGQAIGAVLILAPKLRSHFASRKPVLQVTRSAMLFTATLFFFSAYEVLPLAVVNSVAQTAPLIITALAALFLGESVGVHRWASVVLGFAGAVVILRPGFGAGWEVLLPLAGAFAFSMYNISTRFLADHDSTWTTFLYTGVVGAIGASLLLPFVWETPDWSDVPMLVGIGVVGGLGQLILIIAFSYAPASMLAPFLYIGLVWALLAGALVFGEALDLATIAGAAMIVAAGLYVRYREQRRGVVTPALPRGDR